jgi:hypothetical protein
MKLYLVTGEEGLNPDNSPYRTHIAFAPSEAVARILVERVHPDFKIANIECVKNYPGDGAPSHLVGSINVTPLGYAG